ncbi:YlbF family regulator [Clostridium sp. A1-XYC3]|uniref:YlbF family regulator n=1 Tax=Clostridium tanneri TaxID=3037988 RepID=A0ABU4JSJ5_9CLOT|nr:YlbF family regulator [Clostridium sp. A1-XYC3]MDW8801127.1 YlbF family regulator [Clostridium sp. A1-XYC3]
MNIYDKTHEFAKELRNVPEIVQLRELSKKIETDETNKRMLSDFRRVQFEAYSEQVEKGSISDSVKEKLNNIGSVISMNPTLSEYLQAEQRFSVVWDDILKILNDAIGIDFGFATEK